MDNEENTISFKRSQWYEVIINSEIETQKLFEERALLLYLKEYLNEIDKRIVQKKAQIDGELWNHEGW